jgi:hypothetical protein
MMLCFRKVGSNGAESCLDCWTRCIANHIRTWKWRFKGALQLSFIPHFLCNFIIPWF